MKANMNSLHLNLIYAYEDDGHLPPDDKDVIVDARFLSEPWEEKVMFETSDDGLLTPEPGELTLIFHDREMGVVVYHDALINQIISVLVTEKEMN